MNPVQARTLPFCAKTVVFQGFSRFNKSYCTQSTNNYQVFDGDTELPAQKDGDKLVFDASLDGLGYCSYLLEKIQDIAEEEAIDCLNHICLRTICCQSRFCLMGVSLPCAQNSAGRLEGFGNVLKGKLLREDKSKICISNENASDSMRVTKGKLYDKVAIEGAIEDIPYRLTIRLPHGLGTEIIFDLNVEFRQLKNNIGAL